MAEATQAESTQAETQAESTGTRDLRRSPAGHLAQAFVEGSVTGSRGVSLREVPFLAMVGVRIDPGSAAGARVAAVPGSLPGRCGDVATGPDGIQTLWLAPQEFLVTAPEGANGALTAALVEALADDAGQVVDLSANRTTLELAGPSAREVLEKSCALDLHPRVFRPGTALATEVGNIPVLLHKTGEQDYRIFPRGSFADFLGRWLLDGMREFASAEAP